MFRGRESELKELNALYKRKGFQFIVMYGRRRVGKTALITEFIKDKESIFYISLERNDQEALRGFSESVMEYFPSARTMVDCFPSWDKAFAYIAEQAGKRRLILAIDEYPYLATGNPSISSIVQKYADTVFAGTNLFLILCGSSMSFMENQVLGHESPLYGRRTAQFRIEPFDYFDAGLFFPAASAEDRMLAYAVCGGIPQYLLALAGHGSVIDGIHECFFKKTGILFEEPQNLLKQELREPMVYNGLISAIAHGASKLNEVSTKAGEDDKKCAKYLKSLLDLHIIRKEHPYGAKTDRNGVYALNDNMFRFWFRFIPRNMTNITIGMGREVLEGRVMAELSHFAGPIFEEACRDFMKRANAGGRLPFMFHDIGRWWGTNPATKSQEEIDILADADGKAMFGECKWQSADVRMDVLHDLQRKSMMFGRYGSREYYLFAKKGFCGELRERGGGNGVYLVDLGMMYGACNTNIGKDGARQGIVTAR